jgi:hypothetical protein
LKIFVVNNLKWGLIPAALLLLFLLSPVSYACSVPPPDPWFAEIFMLGSVELPTGVEILELNDEDATKPPNLLRITNHSSTPLYILGTPWTNEVESLPIAVPGNLAPVYKVVADRAFSWGYIRENGDFHRGWEEEEEEAALLTVWEDMIYTANAGEAVLRLDPRNQVGDDRPSVVPFPEPQEVTLHLVYGIEVIEAPLTNVRARKPGLSKPGMNRPARKNEVEP